MVRYGARFIVMNLAYGASKPNPVRCILTHNYICTRYLGKYMQDDKLKELIDKAGSDHICTFEE